MIARASTPGDPPNRAAHRSVASRCTGKHSRRQLFRRREDHSKPRKLPRQRRSRETVGVILEAAAQIFERSGYHAATTNRIAERAGVSVGSLYEYFPNKQALFVALVHRHLEEGRQLLGVLTTLANDRAALPPLAIMTRAFIDSVLSAHAVAPALHRLIFEETRLQPQLRQAIDDLEEEMAVATETILRRHPEVTVADKATAARVVVQIVESLTYRIVLHPRPGEVASHSADVIAAVVTRYLTGT